MLSDFAPRYSAQLQALMTRHFPEENRLLGFRPDVVDQVVRKVYRPDFRFVLGLLRLFRRPVVRFFVIVDEGKLAATTLLSYRERAGYVAMVMVDDPYRRKGYAKRLLDAAAADARKFGRDYLVLDVLANNTPAKLLYEAKGFHRIERVAFWARDAAPLPPNAPPVAPPEGARAIGPKDGRFLAAIARAQQPPEMQQALPPEPRLYYLSPFVSMGLASQSEAWVIDRGQGPEAFVRATVSGATDSGNLTAPVIAPGLPPELGAQLVRSAVDWIQRRGPTRVVTEVTDSNPLGRAALVAAGFEERIATETMALRLDA